MPPNEETDTTFRPLFCPYCREGFEGLSECPEHELTLVPIDRLPRTGDLRQAAFFGDPRLGRGAPLVGSALVLIGFFAPFVSARGIEASALEVAIDGAHNLWLTPGAAVGLLGILWMRRTREEMRSARLAFFGLALSAAFPLAYTLRRIRLMADADTTEVQWLWGLGLMAVGILVALVGSARLGGAGPLDRD